MSLPCHELSEDALMLLATGDSTPEILRELVAAQRSKQALLLWGVERLTRGIDHPDAPITAQAYDLLTHFLRRHPAIATDVISNPAVSAWALSTIRHLRAGASCARPGQLAAVVAAIAVRTGWPCRISVPTMAGRVLLPTVGATTSVATDRIGMVTVEHGRALVEVGEERIRIPADASCDAPGWLGMRTLGLGDTDTGISLLLDDLHPARLPGEDLEDRLPGDVVADWREALDGAWGLLTEHHPVPAEEVRSLVTTITPLTPVPIGLRSASSRETFGCVALSFTRDRLMTALTLTHEVQHVKLCAVLDIVRLIGPDRGTRYYAPWREDPRPVEGLLQGSYAFLGVTRFWRRQRHLQAGEAAEAAHFEFARWREAAELVATTLLDTGDLNHEGRIFVSVMLKTLESWSADHVPAIVASAVRRVSQEHRRRWLERNPGFA
ncbi:HEXXH motif domain-containing protein [Microbispora sp. KK1-11]|uniref:HEXXH motif domain-containing protein n=1 Tax=Microbispora sp. KK1-11 TaxID=2053005 RepID=UPI0011581769|nr:HEXXH motif domain-containing protein [Microbispora sp. KK1-11]TQS25573.1 HEXXH motif domain-containing protein [Microbispora sp. KK1-11]